MKTTLITSPAQRTVHSGIPVRSSIKAGKVDLACRICKKGCDYLFDTEDKRQECIQDCPTC